MKKENVIHTFVVLAYKESIYLEECIKSVLNQSYESKVVIATTTDNEFIRKLAQKYKLEVIVGKHTSIGGDFDFAVQTGKTPLVTVAHQDDLYDFDYAKTVVDEYLNYSDATIIFTDYYEIRNNEKLLSNLNLKIKRILLSPLRLKKLSQYAFIKRFALRFGNSISCPAVTFVKDNCPKKIFASPYQCNVDWFAWERLSKLKGRFIFCNEKLMGHRISEESTTTDIIKKGIRTKEDYEIYCKFWPKWLAKIFTGLYKNSEKSNNIKNEDNKYKNKEKDQIKNFGDIFVSNCLKLLHLNVTEKMEHLLVQIFNFGIVGVVATLIDFIFLYFFKEICHFYVVIANTLSFIISVFYNYWASITFVFDVNLERSKKKSFSIFIICSIIGLCMNDFIVFVVTNRLGSYYLISKVIATIVVMIFNFGTRKKFLE